MDFLRPTWRWINRLTILAWGNWSWTRKGFMLLFHLRIVLHVIHGVISAVKWRIAVSSWRQYQFRNRFVISIFLNSALSNTVASFPGSSDGKVSACNAGDLGLIPGSGRSPGEGNGNPLQYSCLENPVDGGACQATVHGVAESDMTERLQFHFLFSCNCS